MLLLELKELLMELDVPNTDYGYWITGDGKLIPVGPEAHTKVAYQHLGGGGKWSSDVYQLAAEAGWIRVIYRPYGAPYQRLSADIVTPSTRARIALIQLVKMYREQLEDVVINVADADKANPIVKAGWEPHHFTGLRAASEALRFLMQLSL